MRDDSQHARIRAFTDTEKYFLSCFIRSNDVYYSGTVGAARQVSRLLPFSSPPAHPKKKTRKRKNIDVIKMELQFFFLFVGGGLDGGWVRSPLLDQTL